MIHSFMSPVLTTSPLMYILTYVSSTIALAVIFQLFFTLPCPTPPQELYSQSDSFCKIPCGDSGLGFTELLDEVRALASEQPWVFPPRTPCIWVLALCPWGRWAAPVLRGGHVLGLPRLGTPLLSGAGEGSILWSARHHPCPPGKRRQRHAC